ncbi:MAG: HU family DNA-binding protein [Bacteroidales bacterium]|nr:HU family DNA-binding protein [Bacteroidales bacterium]
MSEKINTREIVKALITQHGLAANMANAFVEAFQKVFEDALLTDKVVKINGVGTFKLVWHAPRKSVNVRTGEEMEIAGHYKMSFQPDVDWANKVNEPFAHLEPVELQSGDISVTLQSEKEAEDVDRNDDDVIDNFALPIQHLNEQANEVRSLLADIMGPSADSLTENNDVVFVEEQNSGQSKDELEVSHTLTSSSINESETEFVQKEETEQKDNEETSQTEFVLLPSTDLDGVVSLVEEIQGQPVSNTLEMSEESCVSGASDNSKTSELSDSLAMSESSESLETSSSPGSSAKPKSSDTSINISTTPEFSDKTESHDGEIVSVDAESSKEESEPDVVENISESNHSEHSDEPNNTTESNGVEESSQSRLMNESSDSQSGETQNPKKTAIVDKEQRRPRRNVVLVVCSLLLIVLVGVGCFILCGGDLASEFFAGKTGVLSLRQTQYNNKDVKGEALDSIMSKSNRQKSLLAETVSDSMSVSQELEHFDYEQPRNYDVFIAVRTITSEDRLVTLAKEYYGHKFFWVYIYEANQDVISHPDKLLVGQQIRIPKMDEKWIDVNDTACLKYVKFLGDSYVK